LRRNRIRLGGEGRGGEGVVLDVQEEVIVDDGAAEAGGGVDPRGGRSVRGRKA